MHKIFSYKLECKLLWIADKRAYRPDRSMNGITWLHVSTISLENLEFFEEETG